MTDSIEKVRREHIVFVDSEKEGFILYALIIKSYTCTCHTINSLINFYCSHNCEFFDEILLNL